MMHVFFKKKKVKKTKDIYLVIYITKYIYLFGCLFKKYYMIKHV